MTMPIPIGIFLCHKKILTQDKAGNEVQQDNFKASLVYEFLSTQPEKYQPWIDHSGIVPGMQWESTIYRQLLASDVLLVAVGPSTSRSEWVRREVALAKALNIAVVPLGYDLTDEQFGSELRALELAHIQGRLTSNIKFETKDVLLQEIDPFLKSARDSTVAEQAKVLSALAARRNAPVPKAPDKQKAYSVTARFSAARIALHVASGDLTKTKGIDVLVNSENDYMQMARFFETRTVSALLRRKGTRTGGGRYVDAVQQELDAQLGDRARPVQVAEVFVTSAGGPDSQLSRDNKTRYIFHVAAVQVIDAESRVAPYKEQDRIEECVLSCLAKLVELNRQQGIVSPSGTAQRKHQEELARTGSGTSKSILFPLFGCGQGGGSVTDAMKAMLAGLERFFDDADNSLLAKDLEDIYFAAYTQSDVEEVTRELRAMFA